MNDDPTTVALMRDTPGWYGKLASLGDFAQRRLPPEFVARVDEWLSRSMSAGQQQLGAGWLDVYLTAPVLRFAWAPGVADAGWWFGVLMPSCDNVGRYFPLLIAQRRVQAPADRIALNHLEAWYEQLATAATHTLADRASLDAFEEALAAAPPWPSSGAAGGIASGATGQGQRHELGAAITLDRWLNALAVDEVIARFAGCSIWWRPHDHERDAIATVLRGLPEPAAFAALLAGT
jgi:type VI secretion system protein ImpM